MEPASKLALIACGVFFLSGLLTGAWKYLAIWRSPKSEAPRYVSVAHQTSLMYSFATLILLKFLEYSPYPETINVIAVAVPLFFFATAIITYVLHGALRDTENQFQTPYRIGNLHIPPAIFHAMIWLLILGEIGGFIVLFVGAMTALK
ncbi:MAG: hypothetical protein KGJ80_16035 [Chloroflexota bacterium]|nr:hypothetical protein [Chloroflexota bacterium]